MKHTGILAAALSAVILLAGCGQTANNTDVSNKTEQANNTNNPNLGSEVVMTVGNREITKSQFNFYLTTYKQNMGAEDAKKYALEYCENHNLLLAVADALGVKLDADDKKDIKETKSQMMSSYESNGGYDKFLKDNDLTDDYMTTIIQVSYYADELEDKLGDKEYTDAEEKEFFKNNYRRAKHILISTKDETTGADVDEAKQAEAKAKAEELYKRAQNGEDFDALVKEFSEDPGSQSNPEGYVFTDNEMVKEFQDGVDSIQPGEYTLVKTSYGYHIIKRLALDETPEYFEKEYEKVKDDLDDKMDDKRFDEQLQKWAEEYGIETTVNQELIDAME